MRSIAPPGVSLSGSRSNEYVVNFTAAPPAITVYGIPLLVFQGDKLDFLVNVTAKGTPVNGYVLTANMSDLLLGSGQTDITGNLYMASLINGVGRPADNKGLRRSRTAC